MGKSLKDLANSMRERAKSVDYLGNELAVAGTKAMVEDLVRVTPVDTSQALSNWQVNLVNPAADVIPAYRQGQFGSTRGVSSAIAIEQADTELALKQPGEPVYLSNLVPYIGDLDQGSSRQFAGGFIPRALIVFREAVSEARKRLMG